MSALSTATAGTEENEEKGAGSLSHNDVSPPSAVPSNESPLFDGNDGIQGSEEVGEYSSILAVNPSSGAEASPTTAPDSSSVQPNTITRADTVDSALLSAMRDNRERVSLLRFEQVLLDFLKERDLSVIQVGGPGNSIVVGLGSNGEQQNNYYNSYPRQTSFQRCWLHRLCDRFRIAREPTPHFDGLIRLIKTDESARPKRLLIDLEPHEYSIYHHQISSPEYNGGTSSSMNLNGVNNHRTSNGSGSNWSSTSMSNLSISGNTGSSTSNSKKKGRMKIMKRNSSNAGSSSSLTDPNASKASSRRKVRNLPDKEKAYAEARARIFNEDNSDDAATTKSSITTPLSSSRDGITIDSTTTSSSSRSNSTVTALRPTQVPTDFDRTVGSSFSSSATTDKATSSTIAANSTSNVKSKVTWRNRQQEENDPDFQRGYGAAVFTASATKPQNLPQQAQQTRTPYGYHHQPLLATATPNHTGFYQSAPAKVLNQHGGGYFVPQQHQQQQLSPQAQYYPFPNVTMNNGGVNSGVSGSSRVLPMVQGVGTGGGASTGGRVLNLANNSRSQMLHQQQQHHPHQQQSYRRWQNPSSSYPSHQQYKEHSST